MGKHIRTEEEHRIKPTVFEKDSPTNQNVTEQKIGETAAEAYIRMTANGQRIDAQRAGRPKTKGEAINEMNHAIRERVKAEKHGITLNLNKPPMYMTESEKQAVLQSAMRTQDNIEEMEMLEKQNAEKAKAAEVQQLRARVQELEANIQTNK